MNLVVVAAILLERILFNSPLHKPQSFIKPPRGFVVADHRQLDQFDGLTRNFNDRLDQPPPDPAFLQPCRTYIPTSRPL